MSQHDHIGSVSEAKLLADAQKMRSQEMARIMRRVGAFFRSMFGDLGQGLASARRANHLIGLSDSRLAAMGMSRGDIAGLFGVKKGASVTRVNPAAGSPAPARQDGDQAVA